MLSLASSLVFGLCPQGIPNPPVVINEFQYDEYTRAVDVSEYVELYNRSAAPVDISGWTLTNHDVAAANTLVYTVQANTILQPGQYWVMGAAGVTNVNQVLAILPGQTEILRNENQALTLRNLANVIVDTVAQETNKGTLGNPTLQEGDGIWGNFQCTPSYESSWSRARDGYDTNNNGRDFRIQPWTPGATNTLNPRPTYFDIFDQYTVGAVLTEWGGSFKPARAIDPTQLQAPNPNVIPASPQGGKAAIFWDETGGGNMNMLLADIREDWLFEAYVYFDAVLRPAGEYESWGIGAQGGTCSFFNHPDPSRTLYTTPAANGNSGVAWVYQITSTGGWLYLVDHNDGGKDHVLLGKIQIQQGVNDGWQRLRLQAKGRRVEGIFGGAYGTAAGTHISGYMSSPAAGGLYVGYRELLANNGATRPVTMDLVTIASPVFGEGEIGNAVATTKGTPTLTPNGFPMLGWAGYQVDGSGLAPNSQSLYVIGGTQLGAPIHLGAIGGQQGSYVYISLDAPFAVPTNANGLSSLPLPLPNNSALQGASIYLQNFDVDVALALPLPVGNSKALKLTLGL